MKYFNSIIIILLFLTHITFGQKQSTEIKLIVKNPVNFERKGEIISVKLTDLIKINKIFSTSVPAVYIDSTKLTSQIVRYGGKNSDELIFQSDFAPKEKKEFIIKPEEKKQEFQPLTFAGFMLPREDLAWENDRIAFRMYGPALAKEVNNGIDVWTKRVRYPIVEKWYKKEEESKGKDNYHTDTGEGADFFSVGRTLGAGSSALLIADTVCQPGVFSRYKIIASGPLRTCFELYYDSFFVNGSRILQAIRITLDAGENLNKIEVTFSKDKKKDPLQFAAGLVKRNNIKIFTNENECWLSLWGPTNNDELNGELGLGLIVPRKYFDNYSEDKNQYLIKGISKFGDKIVYYAGAGWTKSGDFKNADEWNNYLTMFSRRLNAPLIIQLSD